MILYYQIQKKGEKMIKCIDCEKLYGSRIDLQNYIVLEAWGAPSLLIVEKTWAQYWDQVIEDQREAQDNNEPFRESYINSIEFDWNGDSYTIIFSRYSYGNPSGADELGFYIGDKRLFELTSIDFMGNYWYSHEVEEAVEILRRLTKMKAN